MNRKDTTIDAFVDLLDHSFTTKLDSDYFKLLLLYLPV